MILLVEDQPLLAIMMQCALEEAGHKVTLATNGQQALEALDGGLISAVLVTDIRNGGCVTSGLERADLSIRANQSVLAHTF